jgi:hypothetical protein
MRFAWTIPTISGRDGTRALDYVLPNRRSFGKGASRRSLARNKQREPDGSDSIPPRNTAAATGILAQRRLDSRSCEPCKWKVRA